MRFSSKLTAVAVIAVAGAIGSQARASILSFSDLSVSGFNTGTYTLGLPSLTTNTGSYSNNINFLQTVSNYSVVKTPATDTASGLAEDYTKTVTSYTNRQTNYKYDSSSVSVTTEGSTTGSGKFLVITGKLTSSVDTFFSYSLSANGTYTSTTIPGIGATPNGSVSFFTGPNASTLASEQTTTTYSPLTSSFSSYSSLGAPLKANETVSFAALVYSSDASLSNFSINGYSGQYGYTYKDTPETYTDDRLVGSHLLSPTPEPETYAMLLAGLGLMGAVVRRRKAAVAA